MNIVFLFNSLMYDSVIYLLEILNIISSYLETHGEVGDAILKENFIEISGTEKV